MKTNYLRQRKSGDRGPWTVDREPFGKQRSAAKAAPHAALFGTSGFGLRSSAFLVCAISLILASRAFADFPVPSFTFYGEVRNAYGWPYTQADNAQVIVRVNGRECGRAIVDERIGPGINYRVEVPLDNGQGALYAPFAARQGDRPTFVIQVGSQEYTVMDATSAPPIGTPGGRMALNFFRDSDTDGDGLPDTWEQMILFASGGSLTNLSQVRPEDDFDGDGMSNGAEFIAGTDPTWDVDVLAWDAMAYLPQVHRVALGFYSVRAKTYAVESTPSFTDWRETDFSLNATNNPAQKFWRGDGYYSWLFVDTQQTNSRKIFRLKAQ